MSVPLQLDPAPRTLVFRALESIVRGNAVFQRIVKPGSFRTWQGKPDDAKPFTIEIAPAMRWTPAAGPDTFLFPDTQRGDLLVNIEILIKTTDVDDMLNFWWMLVRCFYPPTTTNPPSMGGPNAIRAQLQAAGAVTGLVNFTQPAFDPDPDGVFMAGHGQLRIEVRSDIQS
jgi:hypothetical protein